MSIALSQTRSGMKAWGGQKDMGMWVCVGDGKQKRKGTYIFKSNSNHYKTKGRHLKEDILVKEEMR